MIVLYFILIFMYGVTFLLLYLANFKVTTISNYYPDNHQFSILIPFRNQNNSLEILLQSIAHLNYNVALFEVILIDDNDIKIYLDVSKLNFNIQKIDNLRSSNAPKKDALTLGIKNAKFPLILTVDSDCEVPVNWLQNYNNYCIENPEKQLIIGQVKMLCNHSILQIFQTLEFDVLQAITKGSFAIKQAFMCNGANLCFTQKIFNQVDGYQGNTNIASGDDVFLLQKINVFNPDLIGYCNHTEKVTTTAENTWKNLWNQRLRWASKTKAYQSNFAKFIAILVFLTHFFSCIILFQLICIQFNVLLFALLIFKYFIHLLLLSSIQKINLKTLIISMFFEVYYSFFTTILTLVSLINPKINWK